MDGVGVSIKMGGRALLEQEHPEIILAAHENAQKRGRGVDTPSTKCCRTADIFAPSNDSRQ